MKSVTFKHQSGDVISNETIDKSALMIDHEKIAFFRQIEYKDYPRNTVKIEETRDYLKVKEIPCIKYHYGFDQTTQNMDSNFSLLKLS